MTNYKQAIDELEQGNYSDGMVILEKLLENDPENVDILYNLGMCYSEIGMVVKSIMVLKKCIELEPHFAYALVALGFAYNRAGADEEAAEVLHKALELEPDNVYALQNLGGLYNKAGDAEKAYECLEKADTLSPGNPQVELGLAQALELKKEYHEATNLYLKVRASNAPDSVTGAAVEGLNRIATEQLKGEGREHREDVIMYFLSAIEYFAQAGEDKVKEVAFEIAALGQGGLAINNPEIKYTLNSMEGSFTGMQLLCYMFAGFKVIDNSLPPVADLEEEYKQALKIYRSRLDEH